MLTTSARLLRLLSLLQSPGEHTGPALAEELEVSARTLRTDIATLRELGYPVDAAPGVGGGYRLGVGGRMPPMLLDDDEAVAVALALTVAATNVAGAPESAARALGTILHSLPSHLRHRLDALTNAVAPAAPYAQAPQPGSIDSDQLQELSRSIRDRVRVRFEYVNGDGAGAEAATHREAEPYRVVLRGTRWYLVGWDIERDDWRTFRVDRMRIKTPPGRRFSARPAPAGGFEQYLERTIQTRTWATRYRVRLFAPADEIRTRAPMSVDIEPDGPDACIVTVGASSPASVARYLAWWNAPFEVLDSPELLAEVRLLADRYTAASAVGRSLPE